MLEGLDEDDAFRMVEDEFLLVANTFTVHLHAAEYHRLKALARTRNAQAIRDISRPTVGIMTEAALRQRDVIDRAIAQRSGLSRAGAISPGGVEDEDEENAPWKGTSLEGLMETHRMKPPTLARVVSNLSTTRAAAGFVGRSPSKPKGLPTEAQRCSSEAASPTLAASSKRVRYDGTDDDEDLDLDRPAQRKKTTATMPRPTLVASNKPSTSGGVPIRVPGDEGAVVDIDSDFTRGVRERRLREKEQRLKRMKSREMRPKAEETDMIPTFL